MKYIPLFFMMDWGTPKCVNIIFLKNFRTFVDVIFSKGVERPLLYNIPSIIQYPLDIFFTSVASDGYGDKLSCSMYSSIGVIQESGASSYCHSDLIYLVYAWYFLSFLNKRVIDSKTSCTG